jgi:aspartyl-tRNA(Asn)/glutamyl-tRNA(Gln) amidotransferase subunit A
VGLKPTHGLVDATDVLPLAWSLDHVGPMARSVEDVRLALGVLADRPTTSAHRQPGGPPRLGIAVDLLERAERDVRANAEDVARRFANAGATVTELKLPVALDLILAIHRVTMQSEDAAGHALGIARWRHEYSPRIRAETMVGQLIPSSYYLHAQRLRRRARTSIAGVFESIDVLLSPTASNVAPTPETTGDPSLQAPWSLFGMPSITLPSGLNGDGLPFGTQLVAPPFSEAALLHAAAWCEARLEFNARPPLS